MADAVRALLRWLAAHDCPERVLLACADAELPRVARGTVVVRLEGCVRDVGVGLPAQLLASGVGAVEVLPCPDAPDAAAAHVAAWSAVLPDGVTPFVAPRRGRSRPEVLVLGRIPLPRRTLLGLGLRDTTPLDLELDDAARTLAALRLLEESGRARPREAPAVEHPAATRLLVDGCTACGVCVRACPHDALVLEHADGTSTLTHLREQCRSEHECVRLCPVDAYSAAGPLPLAELLEEPVVTLARLTTAACERCGAKHPADEGALCPTCRYRGSNAFGSALPPALLARLAPGQGPRAGAHEGD
ncbi:4Fe-4S dicluster domain-containing protein [Georgenia phoenicis]|uniref:4Fe-4S dicluster domain-containing protein n=1 Tax=unclassified Georgenia TaxID=2626815 RepID=UPI0039B121CD